MKFYDMKTREQKMCGFRSDREQGYAFGMFILLAVIIFLK